MEQWNSVENLKSFEISLCESEDNAIEVIFDFLTEAGLNKEKSSLMEVLRELYLIQILGMMNLNDIKELTNCIKSMPERKFYDVIVEIEKKCEEINSRENKKIEFKQDWENFYSNRKKDIWAIIEGVTGEKRPKVKQYKFSIDEKLIFWEILTHKDRKLLNKLKNGNISSIDIYETDVVSELLELFKGEHIFGKRIDSEVVYNRIEKEFYKSYKECMDALEKLKNSVEQCKERIDDDEKYIKLLYDVANDIDKIKGKIDMVWIKERIEKRMEIKHEEK